MFNKAILSGIVAGSLLATAVPASAQLLGGGLMGAGAGSLGAQMGQIGANGAGSAMGQGTFATGGLDGARSGLGRVRDTTRNAAANAATTGSSQAQASASRTGGQATGAASATNALGANVSKAAQPAQDSAAPTQPQPGLLSGAGDATTGGSIEKDVAGRRVSGQGNSTNHVSRDASGLNLSSANDGQASITKVPPPAETQPATTTEQK